MTDTIPVLDFKHKVKSNWFMVENYSSLHFFVNNLIVNIVYYHFPTFMHKRFSSIQYNCYK